MKTREQQLAESSGKSPKPIKLRSGKTVCSGKCRMFKPGTTLKNSKCLLDNQYLVTDEGSYIARCQNED